MTAARRTISPAANGNCNSGYEWTARREVTKRYNAAGVRVRKGRVEVRRAVSYGTGWGCSDIGSVDDVAREIYPHLRIR